MISLNVVFDCFKSIKRNMVSRLSIPLMEKSKKARCFVRFSSSGFFLLYRINFRKPVPKQTLPVHSLYRGHQFCNFGETDVGTGKADVVVQVGQKGFSCFAE
jgi:hypothetical protein